MSHCTGLFGWCAGLIWGASNILFTSAIQHTAVANVLVIVASNTVFSSAFSYFMLKEVIPIRMWVTSFVCFGAIALIFSGSIFVSICFNLFMFYHQICIFTMFYKLLHYLPLIHHALTLFLLLSSFRFSFQLCAKITNILKVILIQQCYDEEK